MINKFLRKQLIPYSFLAPSLVLLAVFSILPFFQGMFYSLTDYPLLKSPTFIGFNNFIRLFNDSLFYASLLNTFYYMVVTIVVRIALGLALALFLNQKLRGRTIYRAIFYFPVVAPLATMAIVWRWIFNEYSGLLNAGLDLFGIAPIPWLTSTEWAMPSIIIMSIWKTFGWNLVIFLAGLQGIPESLREAAEIDGANTWQTFRHITLPLLRPTILLALVTSTIAASQVFEQVYIMTGGGPGYSTMTLVQMVYTASFQNYEMGYASAVSVILFAIILVFTVIQFKYFGEEVKY
jgi:multiple sugar transport system permease protein